MAKKRLSVVIDADTSRFTKSVNGMQGTVKKATSGIGGAFKKVGGAVGNLVKSIGKIAGTLVVFKALNAVIGLITGSVSGAISRFDTLQNADKVFANMGFEAEETKRMMDNLNDSITGLPTPLDSAVQGVQRLASSTGDLEGSEQIYSALNNAVLGFGGSNEEVDRTVTMLSRSLQKGKIQGDEFNTMMDTMGPVMNAVAEEMGYTTSELQSGLSDGSISVDEFTDTLLRMNDEGGGGLESLEQIARDATGGIGTSIANMKTAFTRGMADIITAINEALEDRGLPTISEMIQNFGSLASDAFGRVAESIGPAIDWLTNLYNTITESTAFQTLQEVIQLAQDKLTEFSESETWESIKTTLEEIGQAILDIDFNEVLVGLQEFIDKWGVFIAFWIGAFAVFKTITFVISLFTALGAVIAFLTSPIGIVVVAITAFIAIGIALWKNWEKIKAKAIEIWGNIKDYFIETWESIKEKSAIWDFIKEFLLGIWESIKTTAKEKWDSVKENIINPIKEAWNNLKAKVQEIKTGISTKWNEIKTDAQTKWNEVKSKITTPIKEAWNNLKTKVDEIKTGIRTRFNSVKTNVTTTWNNIRDAIKKPIEKARDLVEKAINKIKDFMDFKWEFPKLKMPHFSVTGKFGLNPPSVPKLGLEWYAKGGIATGPSIVGIGEAGDEAILPLSNKSKMKPFAQAVASMMPNGGYSGNVSGGDTIITGNHFVVREEADIKKIAQELKRLDDRESRSRGRRGLGN